MDRTLCGKRRCFTNCILQQFYQFQSSTSRIGWPNFHCGHILAASSEVYNISILHNCRGRDSSVGIATRYGLDGPGIQSHSGTRSSRPAHPASYTMVTGSFPGVKRLRHGFEHPPPSSAKFEGRTELYFCSPSGPSWPVLGRTLYYIIVFEYNKNGKVLSST